MQGIFWGGGKNKAKGRCQWFVSDPRKKKAIEGTSGEYFFRSLPLQKKKGKKGNVLKIL